MLAVAHACGAAASPTDRPVLMIAAWPSSTPARKRPHSRSKTNQVSSTSSPTTAAKPSFSTSTRKTTRQDARKKRATSVIACRGSRGARLWFLASASSTRKARPNLRKKHDVNFPLLADADHAVAEKYGVWQEKSRYGRKYMGIARTTYLIDGEGKVSRRWDNVKVDGHADEVMNAVAALERA